MKNQKFLDRKLPERSYLDFEYEASPHPNYIRLPFFENVKISETRNSNLVTHSPIGRNSPLFSWIGAGARNISLKFNLTLPLLIESVLSISEYKSIAKSDLAVVEVVEAESGFGPVNNISHAYFALDTFEAVGSNVAQEATKDYIKAIKNDELLNPFLRENRQLNGEERAALSDLADDKKEDTILGSLQEGFGLGIDALLNFLPAAPTQENIRREQVIAIVMFWLNTIRTSVLNNSSNPQYGPPLIRLNHGVMFRDVACVCQGYSIQSDQKAGMDLKTLLPRVLQVDMKLMEVRVGNFSTFAHRDPINKFNDVGWEVLINNNQVNSIDPGKDKI